MDDRIAKIEKDLALLTQSVNTMAEGINKMQKSIEDLVALQTDTKVINEKLSGFEIRLKNVESSISWVSKTMIGGLLTGSIGVLFFILRKIV